MPTSSSKPLITAPLSLLRTEARQPASLRSQGALLRGAPPSPGFRHACPRASAGTIPLPWQQLRLLTGPTPTPDLKGRPVNWAPLALAARSSWVPLAGLSHRPPSSPSAHYNHRAARGASCLSPRPREIAPHPAPLPPPPGPGPRTGTRSHGHRCSDPGGSRSECLRYPPRHSGRSPEAVPWGQTAGRSRSCSEGPGWRRWLWARDKVGRYVGGCRGSSGTVSGTCQRLDPSPSQEVQRAGGE